MDLTHGVGRETTPADRQTVQVMVAPPFRAAKGRRVVDVVVLLVVDLYMPLVPMNGISAKSVP
jgi:hypothetical protein